MTRPGLALLLCLGMLLAACGQDGPPAQPEPAYKAMTVEEFQAEVAGHQGPLVVAVMSASCGPCLQELPMVDALRRELPGLAVIGLSLDYSEENLRFLLDRTGIRFPVRWTGEAAIEPLSIRYLPLLILTRDGKEIGRVEGLSTEEELRAIFLELLHGP